MYSVECAVQGVECAVHSVECAVMTRAAPPAAALLHPRLPTLRSLPVPPPPPHCPATYISGARRGAASR